MSFWRSGKETNVPAVVWLATGTFAPENGGYLRLRLLVLSDGHALCGLPGPSNPWSPLIKREMQFWTLVRLKASKSLWPKFFPSECPYCRRKREWQKSKNYWGISFQNYYMLLCWSVPDTNWFLKCVIFSVLSMAQQNYIYGSRGINAPPPHKKKAQ